MNSTYENSFLQMVRQYESAIYKVCWMFVGTDAEAVKDLYQEIILRLWKGYEKYHHDNKDYCWIYKISLNTAISYKRKKTLPALHLDRDAENIASAPDTATEELFELVNRLDPLEKSIIYLYLEQRSYREIGMIIGISETNVGTKMQRIKQKLKLINDSI